MQEIMSEKAGITGFIQGSVLVLRGSRDKSSISYRSHTPVTAILPNERRERRAGLRTERFAQLQSLQPIRLLALWLKREERSEIV